MLTFSALHILRRFYRKQFLRTIMSFHFSGWVGSQSKGRGQPAILRVYYFPWTKTLSIPPVSSLRMSLFLRVWPLVSLENSPLTMSNYQLWRHVSVVRGIQFRPWLGIPAIYQTEKVQYTCVCPQTQTHKSHGGTAVGAFGGALAYQMWRAEFNIQYHKKKLKINK